MKFELITDAGSNALLMFFTGWSCDAGPLRGLSVPGYDVMVLWDFSDMTVSLPPSVMRYDEIIIAAWSFGAVAASRFMADHSSLPITLTVAFNATLQPVSDTMGIPGAIFEGTLNGLNERTLSKFRRRMGAGEEFTNRQESDYDIESLRQQLRVIREAAFTLPTTRWDHVFISADDRIIPAENQLRFWQRTAAEIHTIDGAHLPAGGDFASLIAPLAVNKQLVRRRFGGCASTYNANATVQRQIAERLASMIEGSPREIVEIGSGTGILTDILRRRFPQSPLTPVDIAPCFDGVTEADGELYPDRLVPESADLIISSSTVQWFNSPAKFLARCHRALRQGGRLLISTYGPDTFGELRRAGAPTLTFIPRESWSRMAEAVFSHADIAEDRITLTFDSPAELLRHIKLTGVNAIDRDGSVSAARRLLNGLAADGNGNSTLTYNPIYIRLQK